MNNRKPILYILLTALGLILIYNYVIAPYQMQNNYSIGMGMHWRMYQNTNYIVDYRWILIIAVIIAGFLLFELLNPQANLRKCLKCGKEIESDQWRICPVCGNTINNKKG
ncbi:MAG: hypothetical protein CVU84_10225 [Firmicutes bacterium HGW-Firmicutes-1]|jgi:hypothetical protein|nr:MAG: hypothetical protein CVU84_10225 [Firmicutes bacterium HGW-Firmicutes-1]